VASSEHRWSARSNPEAVAHLSPAPANLTAFGLDRRLAGSAAALGATHTRYADDLTLSGGGLLLARVNGAALRTSSPGTPLRSALLPQWSPVPLA